MRGVSEERDSRVDGLSVPRAEHRAKTVLGGGEVCHLSRWEGDPLAGRVQQVFRLPQLSSSTP